MAKSRGRRSRRRRPSGDAGPAVLEEEQDKAGEATSDEMKMAVEVQPVSIATIDCDTYFDEETRPHSGVGSRGNDEKGARRKAHFFEGGSTRPVCLRI